MSLPTPRKKLAGDVFRATGGNFLEMYDFMVYGFYAGAIAATMFPPGNEYFSLMLSFVTFGVGFIMRPLGAIVLGSYIDRKGRRKGLILSLTIMAAGVLIIAFTPTYGAIGIAAPILILVGRLLQGFSAGAESGGVSTYLAEIAPKGRRGFFVSWQSASQQVSVMVAAVIGVSLYLSLSTEQVQSWGWRIPFIFGSLLVPFLFYIRRTLQETEEFSSREKKKQTPEIKTIFMTLLQNWKIVGIAILLVVLTSSMFYLITTYTPTFGQRELHLSAMDSYIVSFAVGLSNFIWIPIMGALSDKVGRGKLLLASSIIIGITAYPVMMWLVAAPSFGRLLTALLWLSFLYGSYQGVMVVTLTEIMPAQVRATGFSVAYSLAQAVVGGFTPAIATGMIHQFDNTAAPGIWLAATAVVSLIGAIIAIRTGVVSLGPRREQQTEPVERLPSTT
ncbi:MFS transporter [Brevibacterium sp. RIT 803]|uniref:MFS transporter n=1 Tax=Brevibacterium sp. RIT 803 TaxID=2810210 RepID=UPI00194EF2D1|nr:MFS transporter [Brevibacterium sp. RIT 803]MBM6588875.1 MFS transporter [Brevibacterium sp. RIT 803]